MAEKASKKAKATAATSDIIVNIDNARKRYGGQSQPAVSDFSVEIPHGLIFGLIGANGAGKTTLLKLIATLIPLSSGDITVGGYSVMRQPLKVRNLIGYMPDDFGLYNDMLVQEYLEFYAACYGIYGKKRSQLIKELLMLVDLGDRRRSPVKALSRGMRQRLCLAHTLVNDPQVLLLDEPASGLDPRARLEQRELLKELARMGKTIIVSSHVLSELENLCDSIAIMQHGKLIACGTAADVASNFGGARLRTIHVRVLSRLDLLRAEAAAKAFVYATGVTVDEAARRLQVEINGDELSCAAFLSFLTASNVNVTYFGQSSAQLENFFLSEEAV